MRRIFITAFVVFLTTITFAQKKSSFGIKFTGFVKTDVIYDSRQTVAAREGHFNLYPSNEDFDAYGEDINAKSNFNMLSIQTRLKGVITGPDAFGAKTSALIEGAFFGQTNGDVNGFRLRHAFAKLNWENTELLVGQYWHAMFITDCFPGTVSFNTGTPFQPFSRNPQIRLTHKANDVKFVFAAMSQRDFASTGPMGGGSQYLRNNTLPELNFTFQYHKKNSNGNEFLLGAGADYLSLTPRIETPEGYATNESVSSFSFMAFMKIKANNITWKLEGVLGQNTTHLTMLGGYAETDIINPTTQDFEYTPLNTLSVWTEIHTNGKDFQAGLFAGYTKNNGFDEELDPAGSIYARGANIDYVYRIAPRLIFNSGKMRFAGEIEYTAAAYGTTQDDVTVANTNLVGNLRFLVGVHYFFLKTINLK